MRPYRHHIIIAAQRKLLEAVNILAGSDSRRSESIETLIVRVTQMIEIFRQLLKFLKIILYHVSKPKKIFVVKTSQNYFFPSLL